MTKNNSELPSIILEHISERRQAKLRIVKLAKDRIEISTRLEILNRALAVTERLGQSLSSIERASAQLNHLQGLIETCEIQAEFHNSSIELLQEVLRQERISPGEFGIPGLGDK